MTYEKIPNQVGHLLHSGKETAHEMLDADAGKEDNLLSLSRLTNLGIMGLILLSVVAIALSTVNQLATQYQTLFRSFEVLCVAVFTVEYLLRLWSIPAGDEYDSRLAYAKDPYMLIDLLAILPFYLGGVADLRFIRVLRLVRVFRVLKLARYSNSLKTMGIVLRKKKPDLVIAFVVISMLVVLTSSALYFAERAAQPNEFSSIPKTLWWSIVTLSTVGYGNVVPVTPLGRFFAGITALLGIGLFGLPASILAAGFIEEATKDRDEPEADTITDDESTYNYHEWVADEIQLDRGGDVKKRAKELAADSTSIQSIHVASNESATVQSSFVDIDLAPTTNEDPDATVSVHVSEQTQDVILRSELIDDGPGQPMRISIANRLSKDEAQNLLEQLQDSAVSAD